MKVTTVFVRVISGPLNSFNSEPTLNLSDSRTKNKSISHYRNIPVSSKYLYSFFASDPLPVHVLDCIIFIIVSRSHTLSRRALIVKAGA